MQLLNRGFTQSLFCIFVAVSNSSPHLICCSCCNIWCCCCCKSDSSCSCCSKCLKQGLINNCYAHSQSAQRCSYTLLLVHSKILWLLLFTHLLCTVDSWVMAAPIEILLPWPSSVVPIMSLWICIICTHTHEGCNQFISKRHTLKCAVTSTNCYNIKNEWYINDLLADCMLAVWWCQMVSKNSGN